MQATTGQATAGHAGPGRQRPEPGRGRGGPIGWRVVLAFAAAGLMVGIVPGGAALGQPGETLRLFPIPPTLAVGESVRVEAFFCSQADPAGGFGADGVPRTEDDRCERAEGVAWSTERRRVARAAPQRGSSTEVTARSEGSTQLIAKARPSANLSFESRVPIEVTAAEAEPEGPAADDGDTGDGPAPDAVAQPVPEAMVAIQPQFAVLPPDTEQLFVAYLCPVVGQADPRGANGLPGDADDFCKLAEAVWELVGDPPVGRVDPEVGVFTFLHAADEVGGEIAFVAARPDEPRDPRPLTGSAVRTALSGGLVARVGDRRGTSSVAVDPKAEPPRARPIGDEDDDGDIDLEDVWYAVAREKMTVSDIGRSLHNFDIDRDGRLTDYDVALTLAFVHYPFAEDDE